MELWVSNHNRIFAVSCKASFVEFEEREDKSIDFLQFAVNKLNEKIRNCTQFHTSAYKLINIESKEYCYSELKAERGIELIAYLTYARPINSNTYI